MSFKSKYIRILSFIILFVILEVGLFAQNCSNKLIIARRLYEAGNIEQVPDQLERCLRSGFTEQQKIEAYKLLIMCRIFEDDMEGADEYMMEFLRKFNYYQINSADDYEFVRLYNSYRTEPVLEVGITGGFNFSHAIIKEEYGVYDLNKYGGKYSSDGLGLQVGVSVNKRINKHFTWSVGAGIQTNKFVYDLKSNEFTNIQLKESQTVFTFPLSVKYFQEFNKYKPYLKLGVYGGLLSSSTGTATREYNVDGAKDVSSSNIDMKKHRKALDFGIETGIGLYYKIKKGYLNIELLYHWGINGEVEPSTRYENNDLVYKYNYVDNKFYLNNLFVNFGVVYPFYKHVKVK